MGSMSFVKNYWPLGILMRKKWLILPLGLNGFWLLIITIDLCRELKKEGVLLASVNDSWFCSYFRKLMKSYARLKSCYLNVPILYVSHFEMEIIN